MSVQQKTNERYHELINVVTLTEAARCWKHSKSTIWIAAMTGRLPFRYSGSIMLLRVQDLRAVYGTEKAPLQEIEYID